MLAAALAWPAEPRPVAFPGLDGTALTGWLFQPADPTQGTVIALHGCGGLYARAGARQGRLNARHQAMAEMLVEQ
ncbi:MAG: dienelactone hydrolase family protein, partial [Burkholderiaceae bacterium]